MGLAEPERTCRHQAAAAVAVAAAAAEATAAAAAAAAAAATGHCEVGRSSQNQTEGRRRRA